MRYSVSYYEFATCGWVEMAQFRDFDHACEYVNQFANTMVITSLETGEILFEKD